MVSCALRIYESMIFVKFCFGFFYWFQRLLPVFVHCFSVLKLPHSFFLWLFFKVFFKKFKFGLSLLLLSISFPPTFAFSQCLAFIFIPAILTSAYFWTIT